MPAEVNSGPPSLDPKVHEGTLYEVYQLFLTAHDLFYNRPILILTKNDKVILFLVTGSSQYIRYVREVVGITGALVCESNILLQSKKRFCSKQKCYSLQNCIV